MRWPLYALLSALFAGLTALLAKIGVSQVPSNLATLIRTIVVVLFALAIVLARGELGNLGGLGARDWTALVLSGLATGCSWLFYFAAIKEGPLSAVAPIDKLSFVVAMVLGFSILREPMKPWSLVGAGLVVLGILLTLPTVQESLENLFQRG